MTRRIGAQLRMARERMGHAPSDLAYAMSVHPATIRNWETGRTKPDGILFTAVMNYIQRAQRWL